MELPYHIQHTHPSHTEGKVNILCLRFAYEEYQGQRSYWVISKGRFFDPQCDSWDCVLPPFSVWGWKSGCGLWYSVASLCRNGGCSAPTNPFLVTSLRLLSCQPLPTAICICACSAWGYNGLFPTPDSNSVDFWTVFWASHGVVQVPVETEVQCTFTLPFSFPFHSSLSKWSMSLSLNP